MGSGVQTYRWDIRMQRFVSHVEWIESDIPPVPQEETPVAIGKRTYRWDGTAWVETVASERRQWWMINAGRVTDAALEMELAGCATITPHAGEAPVRSTVVSPEGYDSDRSSLEEWVKGVDALLGDVKG